MELLQHQIAIMRTGGWFTNHLKIPLPGHQGVVRASGLGNWARGDLRGPSEDRALSRTLERGFSNDAIHQALAESLLCIHVRLEEQIINWLDSLFSLLLSPEWTGLLRHGYEARRRHRKDETRGSNTSLPPGPAFSHTTRARFSGRFHRAACEAASEFTQHQVTTVW